jgi:hypothetical protein
VLELPAREHLGDCGGRVRRDGGLEERYRRGSGRRRATTERWARHDGLHDGQSHAILNHLLGIGQKQAQSANECLIYRW